jgi:hypothetical protein
MSTKSVATKGSNLPAIGDFGNYAGKGKESIKDQILVPFLTILQDLSPAVKEERQHAKPGALMNTGTEQIFPRGETLLGVPAAVEHVFTRWRSRKAGGGVVRRYQLDDPYVTAVLAANKERFGKIVVPEGMEGGHKNKDMADELVETFYVMFILISSFEQPEILGSVVLSFSKSKIKKWRGYVTKIEGFKGANRVPLFANACQVGTTYETNRNGESYWNFELSPAVKIDGVPSAAHSVGDPDDAGWQTILAEGNRLNEMHERGEARAADETVDSGAATAVEDPV